MSDDVKDGIKKRKKVALVINFKPGLAGCDDLAKTI